MILRKLIVRNWRSRKEEVLVLTVVTIQEKKLFTNLAAPPIVINPVLRKAKQIILSDRLQEIRVALDV